MIEIQLTRGYVAVVDDKFAHLSIFKWGARVAKRTVYAGRTTRTNKKVSTAMLHRVIMEEVIGRKLISGEHIDHIDGNGLNNTVINLRLCNKTQNAWNMRKKNHNTSGYKGVTLVTCKNKNRWQANIAVCGKRIYLGCFKTPEAAHEAYCKAAQEHYGEYWRAA